MSPARVADRRSAIMTPHLRKRWLESGLVISGLVLLALWSRSYFESRGFQIAESKKLEAGLRWARSDQPETAASVAAFVGPPASGAANLANRPAALGQGVLGRIEIPRLRIAAMVAEGSDLKTLQHAVGHITRTALPGRPGNCALAGHRDTFLRGLGGVRTDDIVRLVTPERTYTYRVEWGIVVDPHQVDVLDSTAVRSVTLITCYPFEYVGHAPKRFVVRARQIESVTFD